MPLTPRFSCLAVSTPRGFRVPRCRMSRSEPIGGRAGQREPRCLAGRVAVGGRGARPSPPVLARASCQRASHFRRDADRSRRGNERSRARDHGGASTHRLCQSRWPRLLRDLRAQAMGFPCSPLARRDPLDRGRRSSGQRGSDSRCRPDVARGSRRSTRGPTSSGCLARLWPTRSGRAGSSRSGSHLRQDRRRAATDHARERRGDQRGRPLTPGPDRPGNRRVSRDSFGGTRSEAAEDSPQPLPAASCDSPRPTAELRAAFRDATAPD